MFKIVRMSTVVALTLLSGLSVSKADSDEKFSTTQSWGRNYLAYSKAAPEYLGAGWQVRLLPSSPSANSSEQTKLEMAALLKLQEKRTTADVARIRREITTSGQEFQGGKPMSKAAERQLPHTYALLDAANQELAKVVFYYKRKFDRVRPSYLDAQLKPAIKNPSHPAYPSGHATQGMAFALLLAELDESRREGFIKDGKTIAENRELAGVHYASDSEAGYRLAEKLVAEWKQHPTFVELIEQAKKEWANNQVLQREARRKALDREIKKQELKVDELKNKLNEYSRAQGQ